MNAANLSPGTLVEIALRDGRLEISPAARDVRLVRRRGFLVAESETPSEPLLNSDVEATIQRVRAEREA